MSAEDHKQALPPGFRLGAYRVVRILGVGGFGVPDVIHIVSARRASRHERTEYEGFRHA